MQEIVAMYIHYIILYDRVEKKTKKLLLVDQIAHICVLHGSIA